MDVAPLSHGTLKSAESNNEWINWADFLHADANTKKLKITYFNNFWVVVVKTGHGTLISEWIVINWAWSNESVAFLGHGTL